MSMRSVVRNVVAYCPFAPIPLAEIWVRNRYRQLCEMRPWSFLRASGQFALPDAYQAGTAFVNEGGTALTGVDTSFTGAMAGRQIKLYNASPVHTIAEVLSPTLLTLSRPWMGPSAAGARFTILQCYVTAPEDFLSWLAVVNLTNMWRMIVHRHSSVDIDLWDPRRSHAGTPYLVANLEYSQASSDSTPLPMFELWPHPGTKSVFPYAYIKRSDDLEPDTVLPRVITDDVLLVGALAELARWPGTEDRKNPLFSLELWKRYEEEWARKVGQAGRQDNEIYQEDLRYDNYPLVPWSASWMQAHGTMEI